MDAPEIINNLLIHYNLNGKSFSEKIGLERPQAIYDIQSGKTKSISRSIANKIISAFPDVDRVWLLTGEGEMLKSISSPHNSTSAGDQQNVNGDNINANNVTVHKSNTDKLLELLANKEHSLAKAQEHIDKLLEIIGNLTK